MSVRSAIEAIERASFDLSNAEAAFAEAARLLDLKSMHLSDLSRPELQLIGPEASHLLLQDYLQSEAFQFDIWVQRAIATQRTDMRGKLLLDRKLLSDDERAKSIYFRDYCAKNDIAAHAGWTLELDGALWSFCLFRSNAQGHFTSAEIDNLRVFLPAANRVARNMALTRSVMFAGFVEGAAAMGLAVLLLNDRGHVTYASPAAEKHFNEDFNVRGGMLVASERATNSALSKISENARTRRGASDILQDVLIPRRDRRPLILSPSYVRGVGADILPGARIIVRVIDLGERLNLPHAMLKRVFSLTPRECEIAEAIANGDSVREAAAGLGILESSARQLIKRLLEKAGVSRQSELAVLLRSLATGPQDRPNL